MRIIYATLAWASGIFLADQLWQRQILTCRRPAWYLWLSMFLLLAFSVQRLRKVRDERAQRGIVLLLFALIGLAGIWRYQISPFAPCWNAGDIAYYAADQPQQIVVTGMIVAEPDLRDNRVGYRLRVNTATVSNKRIAVRGDSLVWGKAFPRYRYGDSVRVRGKLEKPPIFPDFNYRRYLARQGIHTIMRKPEIVPLSSNHGSVFWRALYAFKAKARRTLNLMLPEPEAALANGILLGIESGIPRSLYADFNATSTSHIIVISGFNISIIAGVFLLLFERLWGRKRAAIPAMIGIVLYVLLVGASAAVLRAGLMGLIFIAATLFGRRSTAIISLFASAWIMLALNPLTLWDVGFQLSFMATLGLILLTPALETYTRSLLAHFLPKAWLESAMAWLNDAFVVTLAAQIVTTPMIIAYFGRFSLISLLTNFLILPVQPSVMIGGGIALIGGLIWLPIGRLLAIVPWLTLAYTVGIVRWSARLPHASLVVPSTVRQASALFYLFFGAFFLIWLRRTPRPLLPTSWHKPLQRGLVAAFFLLPFLYVGQISLAARPDGHLHLYALPNNGPTVLLHTPDDQWILLSAGGKPENAKRVLLSLLAPWQRHLDLVIGDSAWQRLSSQYGATRLPVDGSGGRVVQWHGGTLTWVAADSWLLRYDDFRTLLPVLPDPAVQNRKNQLWPPPLTVLLAPGPTAHLWPEGAFLAKVRPGIIILPADSTYPPSSARQLRYSRQLRLPVGEAVEISSDGHGWQWHLRRVSLAADAWP